MTDRLVALCTDIEHLLSECAPNALFAIESGIRDSWKVVWKDYVSSLVEEDKIGASDNKNTDTPSVHWEELPRAIYTYAPWPLELFRRVRRLFNAFRLESFVEARVFTDYRARLEPLWTETTNEAELAIEVARRSEVALLTLDTALERLGSGDDIKSARDQFLNMRAAIQTAKDQAETVVDVLADRRFRTHFLEMLRVLHREVQSAWGTWPRRVKLPAVWALVAFLPAVLLNACIGYVFGSEMGFPLACALPVCVFGLVYFYGRQRVIKLIRERVIFLSAFDPEPDQKTGFEFLVTLRLWMRRVRVRWEALKSWIGRLFRPIPTPPQLPTLKAASKNGVKQSKPPGFTSELVREHTIWRGGKVENFETLKAGTYTAVVASDSSKLPASAVKYQTADITVNYKAWFIPLGVLSIILVAPPLAYYLWGGTPVFSIDGIVSSRICSLAHGSVLWAGPGEVIVNRLDGRLTAIDRSRVARMSRGEATSPRCEEETRPVERAGLDLVPTQIHISSTLQGKDQATFAVPFQSPKASIDCNFSSDSPGVGVGDDSTRAWLGSVGRALVACGERTGRRPLVDIRGFASSTPFICPGEDSEKLNLKLAEMRRANVLRIMFHERGFSGSPLAPPTIDLVMAGKTRWGSPQHMHDFDPINDRPSGAQTAVAGALTQRVEVLINEVGACSKEFRLTR